MNKDLPTYEQTHTLTFLDGPLEGHEFVLKGIVPFAQFQIGGDMDNPVFHFYVLDGSQPPTDMMAIVRYKFQKTFSFRQIAEILPFAQY